MGTVSLKYVHKMLSYAIILNVYQFEKADYFQNKLKTTFNITKLCWI